MTDLWERGRKLNITFKSCLINLNYLNSSTYLTCTDAHYKPGHNDDLIGLGNLTDSHHHSWDDGKYIVEEEGPFPVACIDAFKISSKDNAQWVFFTEPDKLVLSNFRRTIVTFLVCWPVGPPSVSQKSLPEDTWIQSETIAESGSSPPLVCHNAPGRCRYKTAAWTEKSRTILILSVTPSSVSLCVNVKLLFLCLNYRWWRVDHSHIISVLERWTKCRYQCCKSQDRC